jgi:hypothetical protein
MAQFLLPVIAVLYANEGLCLHSHSPPAGPPREVLLLCLGGNVTYLQSPESFDGKSPVQGV